MWSLDKQWNLAIYPSPIKHVDVRHTAIGWLELSFQIVAQIPLPGLPWSFSWKDLRATASLHWKSWCCPPGRGIWVPLSPSASMPAGSAPSLHTSSSFMTTAQARWSWSPRPSQSVLLMAQQQRGHCWTHMVGCTWFSWHGSLRKKVLCGLETSDVDGPNWMLLDKGVAKKDHYSSICFYFNRTTEC